MPDFPELVAGLRRWTANHDDRVRAAVELLIWEETMLRRADFFTAAIGVTGGDYYIRWLHALSYADVDNHGDEPALTVLRLAIWIAKDPFSLSQFGRPYRQAAVDTFAAALGVKPSAVAGDL